MVMHMIHIQREAAKMVEEWATKGFNGVDFYECRLEPTRLDDWLDDGRTKADYEEFIAGYAIFIASPDLECEVLSNHPYATNEVDSPRFYRDLQAEMKRRLGGDIEITHYEGCGEFEIQRIPVSA